MNFVFIVQGEGLGHSTQSLALRSILKKNGHTVKKIFLGTGFFRPANRLYSSVPHSLFLSPVFLPNAGNRGISLFSSFILNIFLSPLYLLNAGYLAFRLRMLKPDAIVVFYDLTGQLASFFAFTGKPVYTVSHHYFLDHPVFPMPRGRKTERTMLRLHSRIASLGATKKLAISLSREPDIPGEKLFVVPPLFRPEVLASVPANDGHLHLYLLYEGLISEVIPLAERYPSLKFKVFLHQPRKVPAMPVNIEIFGISGPEFLDSLVNSSAVITTAGFETLAESVFLNKPVYLLPSEGHFEQYCNSLDALRCRAAVLARDILIEEIGSAAGNAAHYSLSGWLSEAPSVFLKHLSL